jgi:hypothetical protein
MLELRSAFRKAALAALEYEKGLSSLSEEERKAEATEWHDPDFVYARQVVARLNATLESGDWRFDNVDTDSGRFKVISLLGDSLIALEMRTFCTRKSSSRVNNLSGKRSNGAKQKRHSRTQRKHG